MINKKIALISFGFAFTLALLLFIASLLIPVTAGKEYFLLAVVVQLPGVFLYTIIEGVASTWFAIKIETSALYYHWLRGGIFVLADTLFYAVVFYLPISMIAIRKEKN